LERVAPEPATPQAAKTLVEEMLWRDLEQSKTEIMVLVERARVQQADADLPPTAVRAEQEPPRPPSTGKSIPRSKKSAVRVWPVMLAMLMLGVAIAFRASGLLDRRQEVEVPRSPDSIEMVQPRVTPIVEAPPAEPALEEAATMEVDVSHARSKAQNAKAPEKKERKLVRTGPTPAAKAEVTGNEVAAARAKRLIERTMALKRSVTSNPEVFRKVEDLLNRLQLERASPDAEGTADRLGALERELDAIATRPGP
jgi:hypothetical protein